MRIRSIIAVACLVLGLLTLGTTAGRAQDGGSFNLPEVQRIADLIAGCADLEPNTLCYGGGTVDIGLTAGRQVHLEQAATRLALTDVERIQTQIDAKDCVWGGVIMNVQGTLPLSQPGMTFIALGNVTVENATLPETLFQPVEPITIALPSQVNMLAQPSLDAEILTTTRSSISLPADALSADGAWVRVVIGGDIAWVFRDSVVGGSDLSALPVLSEDARGWMQAFTVQTQAPACGSQMPSLLLVQTPDGEAVRLTINGSDFTVGSTVVLSHFSAGVDSPPEPEFAAGEGAPPDDQNETLLVIEGSVAALLADGSVLPIEPGCAFHTPRGDSSALTQEERLVRGSTAPECGVSGLPGQDSALTGSDGGLDSLIFGLSDTKMGSLGLLPLLNDVLMVDIGDPGISAMPDHYAEWASVANNQDDYYCVGFEGISPPSGSILLAPSPSLHSSLPITFRLTPTDHPMANGFKIWTTLNLVNPDTEEVIYRAYTEGNIEHILLNKGIDVDDPGSSNPQDFNVTEIFSYDVLTPGFIAVTESSGTLVWWAEFSYKDLFASELHQCVTELYTLNWSWSDDRREGSSQVMSTAMFNFPTPANTPGPTDSPLTLLGASATPPFTLPTATSVPATSIPPTTVPPTNVPPPTSPPPTANPDRDGDGVVNDQDRCPDEAGPRENNGCPLPPPPPDRDGDGVPDEVDECPGIPGPPENRGCPPRGG